MFLLNNNPLSPDSAFTHNDIQYPANWLRLATSEERAAIGITEAADPERYDDRFYWGVGNPKDLVQLQAMLVDQIKQTAYTLLQPTDYKITRSVELNQPVFADVLAAREAIRTASNANEAAVLACTSVPELAALQLAW